MDNGTITTNPESWPLVMTGIEVAIALRLTDDAGGDCAAARDGVLRLTRQGRLRPLRGVGRSLKYARSEILSFVERETAAASKDADE